MVERDDDGRLWQGDLPADLEAVRAAASRLALPAEPDWSRVKVRPQRIGLARPRVWLPLAASFLVVLGLAWIARDAWRVQAVSGRPRLSGAAFAGRVAEGGEITTDMVSRARLEVPGRGQVTLEPGGCVRRVPGAGTRLQLERGTLHASMAASVSPFSVRTSMGSVEHLGAAYTLTVEDSSRGRLEVTRGRARFENGGRESLLPAGIWCPLTVAGAGVPRREGASEEFLAAVAVTDNPACQSDDYGPVLASAETSDAITLWHLLPRVRGEVRRKVAERFASLIALPREVTLDRIVALDPRALEACWNVLGLGALEEWRREGAAVEPRRTDGNAGG